MNRRSYSNPGFTLVELLVGMTIGSVVMAAVLSSFVFLARNFTRLANLQALERQGRTALVYLQADLALAQGVKTATVPTATSLTLVLPAGDVTYTYDSVNQRLRRQAAFSASPDLMLLNANGCRCTAFAFTYFTGSNGSPLDQLSGTANTPLSIKQVQASFSLQTPSGNAAQTRMSYAGASPRLPLRNKGKPDGN